MARARLRWMVALTGPGLVGAGPESSLEPQEAAQLVEDWVNGRVGHPSLARVQRAAVAALRLEPEARVEGWSDRARSRAWLPRVDIRLGTDRNLDVRRPGSVDPTWTEGQGLGADLALRWRLGGLVFDDAEIRVDGIRRRRSTMRRLAKERVTRLFFERVTVELRRREPEPPAELELEAARLDGLLDAATGGRWGTDR